MTGETTYEQVSLFDPGMPFGKTYPEHSQADSRKGQTLRRSSKSSSKSSSRKYPLFLYLTEDGLTPDVSAESETMGLHFPSLGDFTMGSTGEQPSMLMTECSFPARPNGVSVSRLSLILEDSPHRRYSLSARACQGILNRASKRGKQLPEELETALRNQVTRMTMEETEKATLSKSEGGWSETVVDEKPGKAR